MTVADLLPSNASQLERDLSLTSDVLPKLGPGTERVRTAKRTDIPDDVVPWLIYEYGLGEITPYVPDLRQALAEGIQWQRVRGTRQAINIGLGWIGFDALVEESEAGTLRWADFQMGLDQAPNGLEFTNNVIQISRLSAPIRSRLFRIYGGYDHRRFRLDDHQLSGGSWLCDDTGVYLREDWPQLSFGREHDAEGDLYAGRTGAQGIEHNYTDGGQYEDRMILSCSQLDELEWRTWHLDVSTVVVSRGHLSVAGPWWQQPSTWENVTWDQALDWAGLVNRIAPPLQFAKAGIYLSDGWVLGDTNACFAARYEQEVGFGALLLSEADSATGEAILSEHVGRLEYQEWNERLEQQHAAVAVAAADAASTVTISREHQRLLAYDDVFRLDQHGLSEWLQLLTFQSISRGHTTSANGTARGARNWEETRWLDASTWENLQGIQAYGQAEKTGLYLSDSDVLSSTHATLGWPESERFDRIHQATATEDRQAFLTRQHTRASQTTFVLFAFYGWSDSETWSVGASEGWAAEAWPAEMWVEGNGYWNPTSPLIASSHQSTT